MNKILENSGKPYSIWPRICKRHNFISYTKTVFVSFSLLGNNLEFKGWTVLQCIGSWKLKFEKYDDDSDGIIKNCFCTKQSVSLFKYLTICWWSPYDDDYNDDDNDSASKCCNIISLYLASRLIRMALLSLWLFPLFYYTY